MFKDLRLNEAILRFKEKMRCKMCQHERASLPLYDCKSCSKTVYRCLKCGSYYILDYATGVGYWTPFFPSALVECDKTENILKKLHEDAKSRFEKET